MDQQQPQQKTQQEKEIKNKRIKRDTKITRKKAYGWRENMTNDEVIAWYDSMLIAHSNKMVVHFN